MSKKTDLTRRDFLRNTAGMTLAGAAATTWMMNGVSAEETGQKIPVVLIRDAKAIDDEGKVNGPVVCAMLDQAVANLTGEKDPAAGWRKLIKPEDTVGIKTNLWQFLRTPEELENGIKTRVMEVGVPEAKISIDDHNILNNPIFQQSTALINARPMRTHHWAGVGSCIKNYILFSDKPWSWHEDACANLAGVWDLPVCKGKTRLNVLVMLTPLFHGKGPHHFQKKYTWSYNGLIVGTDPVAVDATGLRVLEAKRKLFFQEDQPFAIPPHHIRYAEERFHLGVADANRIEVRKLGWQEDILI